MTLSDRMLGETSPNKKKAWKDFVVRKAYTLGLFELGRLVRRNKIPILCYHRFANTASNHGALLARDFEAHLQYLAKHFTVISFKEMSYLRQGKTRFKNPLVLTVDDGYRDFLEVAFPLLKSYGIPATLFVTTRFIDGDIWLWPDIVHYAIMKTNRDKAQLFDYQRQLPLRTPADRVKAYDKLIRICKRMKEEDKKEFLEELPDRLGVRVPPRPTAEFRPISWQELKNLRTGRIEIGSHTLTHPILSRTVLEQAEVEIAESKKQVEKKLDCEVIAFSYPNGIVGDYAEQHKDMLRRNGYFCGVTANFGFTTLDSDLFELNRIVAQYEIARFVRELSGLDDFRYRARHVSVGAPAQENRLQEQITI